MSREVKRIKLENPKLDHRVAFKKAANNWAKSPHNCSNQRVSLFGNGTNGQVIKQEIEASVQEPEMVTPEIMQSSSIHEDLENAIIHEGSKDSCGEEMNIPSACEDGGHAISLPEEASILGLKRDLDTDSPILSQKRIKTVCAAQSAQSELSVQEDTASVAIPEYGMERPT